MSERSTTILGVTYAGVPMFRSLALSLHILEERGETERAQRLLDAHNQIRRAFDQPPIDLSQQFTCAPNSMAAQSPTALAALERQQDFEPRPIDRVVARSARAA